MRITVAICIGMAALMATACSSSTTVANSCGSSGANANINTTSANTFSPASATIAHGQSVCWQSGSTLHTVTADGGAFNSDLPIGQIFIFVFPTAGTYPYHCTKHAGMTGTITVT